jgi:hypothetical protein
MRLPRKPCFKNRFKHHQKHLLNNPVLEARIIRFHHCTELSLGNQFGRRLIIGAAKDLVGLVVPFEAVVNDSSLK